MAKRKKEEPVTPNKGKGGKPGDLASTINDETVVVAKKPDTPQDRPEGFKKTRRTKKVIEAEQAETKTAHDQLVAIQLVDMKLAMLHKFGGPIFKAEKEEREVQIAVYAKLLNCMPEIPWWVELALCESMFFIPRFALLQMQRKEMLEKRKQEQAGQPRTVESVVTPSGNLDPIGMEPPQ